jgi:hypothetical protein
MEILGIEQHPQRVQSAHQLRAAVARTWPQVGERYRIVKGTFPSALTGSRGWGPWRSGIEETNRDAILVFTNVGNAWGDQLEAEILKMLAEYAEVILDLRLFGAIRDEESERMALFDRIAAGARQAEHVPAFSGQMHMAHFSFGASI